MTVPKSKREQGKLAVITKSRNLRKYTIKICSNEKSFPKRYRWCLTNQIVKTTNEISNLIIQANAVKVENVNDKQRRLERQKIALELSESLLDDITVSYELFHIESKRISYWTGEIITLQNLLRNWIRSDKERYKNIG